MRMGYAITNTLLWYLALTPATFFGALLVYLTAHRLGLLEIGDPPLPKSIRLRSRESD